MNKAPLISVIVPVYNTAPWLRRCLDSICGQSYLNLEIICVNDGSTDDSAAILAEYAARDSRIMVITQPNSGLSAARNAGLAAATGEYVTGVDSDDYLEPHAYEWVIDRMGERRVDIACFGFMMEEEGKPWQKTEALNMPEGYYCRADIAVERIDNCNFCNKLWKRDFLGSLGVKFPVGLLFEDLAFWNMAAPYAKDFLFYPQCLYHYVQRGSSIMHTADYKAHCMNKIKVFNAICQFWKEKGEGETNLLPVLAKEYDNILDITPFWAKKRVQQPFRHLCLEWGLDKNAYPVADLVNPWHRWNPFYKRRHNGYALTLFCLPVFWVKIKENHRRNEMIYRYMLFGIRIAKKIAPIVKG